MMSAADRGSALILVLIAAGVLSALGAGLVLLGSTDGMIAANFRTNGEAFYAADAAADRAIQDLAIAGAWSDVLSGAAPATMVDPSLTPTLASNRRLDLVALTADLQRRSDAVATWGSNNPRWRLYVYGPFAQITGTGTFPSDAYLVTWVADDPAETDGDPWTDANGTLLLRARALALFGSDRTLDIVISRTGPGRTNMQVLSWRQTQ